MHSIDQDIGCLDIFALPLFNLNQLNADGVGNWE